MNMTVKQKDEIIDILKNLPYWDTCAQDYKNRIPELVKALSKVNNGVLDDVSNSFISVGEKEPPKHIELLVQSPEGQNYLVSWREAYSIFTCQNKGENSFDWKWKEI